MVLVLDPSHAKSKQAHIKQGQEDTACEDDPVIEVQVCIHSKTNQENVA